MRRKKKLALLFLTCKGKSQQANVASNSRVRPIEGGEGVFKEQRRDRLKGPVLLGWW